MDGRNVGKSMGALALTGLLALAGICLTPVFGQEVSSQIQAVPVEMVVKGRQPGPPLWRVTNGDNVLWIFPYLSPVPEDIQWESNRVKQIIAESQTYLPMPRTGINTPRRNSDLELPDKQTLQDVLPAELYARYLVIREEYSFRRQHSFEKLQPIAAGPALIATVFERKGLTNASDVMRIIDRAVRRNRAMETIEIVKLVELDKEQTRIFMSHLVSESDMQGIACFESALNRVAPETDARIQRANAWASGDIDALREIELPAAQDNPCSVEFFPESQQHIAQLGKEMFESTWQEWQQAAEHALINSPSSFAVLDLDTLFNEDGVLKMFLAKGYTVIEPW